MPTLRALVVTWLVWLGLLAAQDGPAALTTEERTTLQARLERLDLDYTDWTLLRDVADKVAVLGDRATPVVTAAVTAAKGREDPRFAMRLLGVLACIDDRGLTQLREFVAAPNPGTASLAARVLGRCGLPAPRLALPLNELLAAEQRPWVASALAMAAGDAGVHDCAGAIRKHLVAADLDPQIATWFAMAFAFASGELPVPTVRAWLGNPSPLRSVAVLVARGRQDATVEKDLLSLLAATKEQPLATWIVQSLAACGGEPARKALQDLISASREDDAGLIGSTKLDPRQLALLRLGDPDAFAWAKAAIVGNGSGTLSSGTTFQVMGPALAQLPELLGKWRLANAAATLLTIVADKQVSIWSRAHAVRGLCWQQNARGLTAAANLLVTGPTDDFNAANALAIAQTTLHEFVANVDRPDYLPFDGGDPEIIASVGRRWTQWLQANAATIRWREPPPDGDNLLLWR